MSQWVQVMQTVVRERRPALVGYAYLMIGSRAEAEDVVQEAIVKTVSRGKAQTSIREAEAYIKRYLANASVKLRHELGDDATPAVDYPTVPVAVMKRVESCLLLNTFAPSPTAWLASTPQLPQTTTHLEATKAIA